MYINAVTVKSRLLVLALKDITRGILVRSDLKMVKTNFPSSPAIIRADAPKITLPTEKQNGFLNGIEFVEAFGFKTSSSTLIVGPCGWGKTCFTEMLLLKHLEELFVSLPPTIHYCYGVW